MNSGRSVVVVGSHRSGSSAVAQAVSGLCETGGAEPYGWDHPLGDEGDRCLEELNERLFEELGGTWSTPPQIDGAAVRQLGSIWREPALEIFRSAKGYAPWLWHDPRLCQLLPFWTEILEEEFVVVVAKTSPTQVVRSLVTEERLGAAHAAALWSYSMRSLLENLRGLPVVFVDCDQLFSESEPALRRLHRDLAELAVDVVAGDAATALHRIGQRSGCSGDAVTSRALLPLERALKALRPSYSKFPGLPLGTAATADSERESAEELLAAHRELAALRHSLDPRRHLPQPGARLSGGLCALAVRHRRQMRELQAGPVARRRFMLEAALAREHQDDERFAVPGFCLLCDRAAGFEVDWQYSGVQIEDTWTTPGEATQVRLPNWRERLICPHCQMNNRQRAVAGELLEAIGVRQARSGQKSDVFLTEQVTPMYSYFSSQVEGARCTGSEYLGSDFAAGQVVDGLRHEDVERLSFENAIFDFVVSSSVLEHVSEPLVAVREMARVLRPGGELFLEIPFDTQRTDNVRRARRLPDGRIEHLLPEEYHGNPMSEQGSLVFHDFGWEFVEQIRETGLLDCEIALYWSLELGHLGGTQFFFRCLRTEEPLCDA